MTRKAKTPAPPPVLPLVAVPYVSPGQVERLRAAFAWSPEWLALVDVFAANAVADQYAALDELRAAMLDLIDERPVDDPRGAVAAPAPDAPAVFAGMTALEAFDGIAGALGFARTEADDDDAAVGACQWCGCAVESGQRVCAPCAAADADAGAGTGGAT